MGVEFNVSGDKVYHTKYGAGIIKKVEQSEEGYWVTVDFENIGEKKLLSLVDPRALS